MKDEKQALFSVASKQRDCEFSLRFILQKKNDLWKNFMTMFLLVKKGTRKEVNYDYGEFVVGEKLLATDEGLKLISSLYAKNSEKGRLSIPGFGEFTIEDVPPANFLPSKQKWGIVRSLWPTRFLECRTQQDLACTDWNRELLGEGLPYYPDLSEAAISICDLAVESFNTCGSVYVAVCDYRARVESLKLALSKVELRLHTPEIKYNDLTIKVFAKSKAKTVSFPDINPQSDLVSFDVGFQPDRLHALLLSKQDNMKIDGKEFAAWRSEDEGIFLERPEEEILSLTKAGESQDLEYKHDVIDDDGKNDLIETVVAFLNTNSGLILVGVHDDGSIVGSHKNADDLQKLIHDSCDPPPEDIRVEERMIENKKVIVVDVPEGDDKPYQSKRDKNWYVRHNANDMMMERSELLRIIRNQRKSERFQSSVWQSQ
jgi:hypothetical protein